MLGVAALLSGACAQLLGLSDVGDGDPAAGSGGGVATGTGSGGTGAAGGTGGAVGNGGTGATVGSGGAGGGTLPTGNLLWAKQFGGNGADRIQDIEVDANDNIWVAGIARATIDFGGGVTTTSAGDSDVLLARFDTDGDAVEAAAAGDADIQQGRAVALDPTGNAAYVATRWTGPINFGNDSFLNPVEEDAALLAFNLSSGAIAEGWAAQYGNDERILGDAIAADDSIIVMGGRYRGMLNALSGQSGTDDALIVARSGQLTPLWEDGIGGPASDSIEDLALTADFVYAVGAFSGDNVTFGTDDVLTMNAGSGDNGFIARYDREDGEVSRAWSFGGNSNAVAWSVAATGSDVIIGGEFLGPTVIDSITFDGTNGDLLVARLDGGDLSRNWTVSSNAQGSQVVRRVAVDSQGDVVIAGMHEGTFDLGGHSVSHVDDKDVFVAKLSGATGAVLWVQSFGGTDAKQLRALAIDSNDNIYIGGYFLGEMTFDPSTSLMAANDDMFLAKLAP
jgi:hypothetical protein